MKKIFFFLILQGLSLHLLAQFEDNFSDTNLAAHWLGDTDKFAINNGELQLNDQTAESNNDTYLFTLAPTSTATETEWSFNARCEFAPSSGNFTTIYLAIDQAPTEDSFNGYFLKVGGISGSDDALELYRQDGNSSTLLIAGTTGAVGSDPVAINVQVVRTTNGEWTLEADYTGGEDFDPQGSIIDNTYPSSLYFGINCHYTATRNMSFFYDNIFIDPIVEDNDGPIAQNIEALTANSIALVFNEPLDPTTALLASNYNLDNGLDTPQSVTFQNGSTSTVELIFSQNLVNLTDYTLNISDIEDLSGNNSGIQNIGFNFLLPETPIAGDLFITEIFADPSPSVGLPSEEYIEIFNNSNKVLQLGGLGFSTGSTPKEINDFILLPQSYVILCDDADVPLFEDFGDIATIDAFPVLTNGGDELSLLTAEGTTLVEVNYDINWYQDLFKSDGGYSLELIDFSLPNDCPGNWRASDATLGGTPGQANSLTGVDDNAPNITIAVANSPTEILVSFDDVLGGGIDLSDFFSISPSVNIGAAVLHPNKQGVLLFLETALADGIVYEITASTGIQDCLGNATTSSSSVFTGLAVIPMEGDIVLNEILFNPFTGGVDFIEFYNPSNKIVELQGIRLSNSSISTGTISTTIEDAFVLLPDSYVVFTPNSSILSSQYTIVDAATIVNNSLPSLGDKDGNITIFNSAFGFLDSLTYTEGWHNQLLSDRNGVSLERLRADAPTQDQGNWHSAASTAGYATPGAINSQDRQSVSAPSDNFFNLPEQTFSPDQDGFQDVLEIQYNTDKAGYVSQLYIFDSQGRLARDFNRLELLEGQGSFLWDGSTNDQTRARIGIYIIVAEIFTPNGDTIKEKHTCVLAGDME